MFEIRYAHRGAQQALAERIQWPEKPRLPLKKGKFRLSKRLPPLWQQGPLCGQEVCIVAEVQPLTWWVPCATLNLQETDVVRSLRPGRPAWSGSLCGADRAAPVTMTVFKQKNFKL